MIRKLIFLLLLTPGLSAAQITFDWVRNHQVNYSLNPGIPKAMVCEGQNADVWFAYFDTVSSSWGTDPVGSVSLVHKDDLGNTLQTFHLGSSVMINDMITDLQGQLYVIGQFLDTLWINQNDTLMNTSTGLNADPYIICLDVNGNVKWKRNLGGGFGTSFISPVLKMSPAGEIYYSYCDFDTGYIIRLDTTGAPLGQIIVDGIRTIGDFGFTPTGGVFITGATGNGSTISVGGISQLASDTYMFYIAYADQTGNGQWIHLAHDITFQTPCLATDPFGNAFVSAHLMDSLTWGNFHLLGPDWVYDFWLVKVDSNGTFHWAKEVPNSLTGITGDFQISSGRTMACDAAGNVMLYGIQRGTIDWGNGLVISHTPISQGNFTTILFDSAGLAQHGKKVTCTTPKYTYNVIHTGNAWYLSGGSTTETGVLFDTIVADFPFGQNAFLVKIIPTTVGLGEFAEGQHMIYPNPGNGIFQVPQKWIDTSPTCIYDLTGRMVHREILVSGTLDLSHLISGTYLVKHNESAIKLFKE